MPENLPQSTSELLDLIEEEWQALMRFVDALTDEQMKTPDSGGWSPKDNLAHLTSWMRYMKDSYLHKMPAHQAWGLQDDEYRRLDEDGINAVLWERNRNLPAADVLAQLKSTYAEVIEDLQSMSIEDLIKPLRESGPDKRLVIESVLGNTSDHFREHRERMEQGPR